MDADELKKWKTKLVVIATIVSALVGVVTYTVSVTLMYAGVVGDIRVIRSEIVSASSAADEAKKQNQLEHDVFRADIRELRQALEARR
jgi:hypothetical protein